MTLPYDDASYGGVRDEILNRGRVFSEAHGDAATDMVAAVPWDLAGRLRPYKAPCAPARASSRRSRARGALACVSRGDRAGREESSGLRRFAQSWRHTAAQSARLEGAPTTSAAPEVPRSQYTRSAAPKHLRHSPRYTLRAAPVLERHAGGSIEHAMVRGALRLPGRPLLPREPGELPHGWRGSVRRRRAEV